MEWLFKRYDLQVGIGRIAENLVVFIGNCARESHFMLRGMVWAFEDIAGKSCSGKSNNMHHKECHSITPRTVGGHALAIFLRSRIHEMHIGESVVLHVTQNQCRE